MANSAILNHVYNYYHHSSYAPKPSSRFDAHKKDDLKNIYNSIIKIDKEAPVFLLDYSEEVENYTIHMKESALRFRDDLAQLGGLQSQTMFEKKSVYSSNPEMATANYIQSDILREETPDIELSIQRLASPQVHQGHYLPVTTQALQEGTYSFDVTTNISSYELQLNVGSTDTSHSLQTRLARLINNSNIGLSATVDYKEDTSALIISSLSTGTYSGEQPFEISDEDSSEEKGLIDHLGIRNASQPAAWASYEVNGKAEEAPTNQVTVDNTYAIELKNVTEQPIQIGLKPDLESLKENLHGLTGAYNHFLRSAAEYLEKYPRTTLLVGSLNRMTSRFSEPMNQLGIHMEQDGSLSIDEDTLHEELQKQSSLESLGSLKTFAETALQKVNQVQLNPMDYVDKRIVAYKNPHKEHFSNPYITSAYSGMLFNTYM